MIYGASAVYDPLTGCWDEDGTGLITMSGNGYAFYEGNGSYSSGICLGTQEEDGHDNYSYSCTVNYALESTGWEVSDGNANSKEDWHDAWKYSAEGSYVNGDQTITESISGNQKESGDYDVYYVLDESDRWQIISDGEDKISKSHASGKFTDNWSRETKTPSCIYWYTTGDYKEEEATVASGQYDATATFSSGAWGYDGDGSISNETSSSNTYSGSGSYPGGGTSQASFSNSASDKSTTDYELDSEGAWQVNGINRKESGKGFTDESYKVEDVYEEYVYGCSGIQWEGGGEGTSYEYLINADLSGTTPIYDGYNLNSYSKYDNSAYDASGEYTYDPSSMNLTINCDVIINGQKNHKQTATTYSELNSNGTWDAANVTVTSAGSEDDHWLYEGSGSYYLQFAILDETGFPGYGSCIVGSIDSCCQNNRSMQYSVTRARDANGVWSGKSGTGVTSNDSSLTYSYSGSGEKTGSYDVTGFIRSYNGIGNSVAHQRGYGAESSSNVAYWTPSGNDWQQISGCEFGTNYSSYNLDWFYHCDNQNLENFAYEDRFSPCG